MSNLTTRAGKGSPLTNNELDANFTNLNADKVEIGGDLSGTSTAPNVAKIQGRAVSADTPENGEKLVWNGTAWEPSVDPTGEPIGHANKADSTISFDSGTRTFTIAPVAASFTVWCKGVKHTYTSAQTVVIPDTTGLHFIYFNASGVLSTQMSYFTWEEHAPTAYIYWNATAQQAVYFGDERHGITLDWQTHEYLHRTRGAAIASGFGASGYTTTGAGSTDADAQIDIGGGTFFDEDLQVDIVSTNTPVAGTWQQDLSGPARIPVLYLSGSAWVIDAPTDFPFKVVSGVPQYNLYSGGTWSAAPVANNGYFVSWILATHNLTYPVVAVISQAATNQVSEAEAMTFEGLTLSGFPSVEFRPLYKVIYQHKTSFANNIKASTIAVYDLRSISSAGVAAALVQDHGNLSGLGDDDHAQYLHVSAVRSPSASVTNSFLPSQASQSGKYLTTDGSNPSWGAIPSGSLTFTGDVTGTGNTGSSTTLTLANSGVTAGTFTKVTVDAKGRVTNGASASSSDITTALGFTPENVSNKAVANGYASLDSSGKVPSNQLPSYVDDVLEYANLAAFPGTGETGKIYIAIDTAKTYRWSGSAYVEITASPGSTDAVPEGSTNLYFTNARARAAVSASGSLSYSTATGIFSYTQPTNVSAFTNDSGYLTGITGAQVTAALGYTPYNATNPAGYTTNVGTVTSVSGTGTVSGLTLTGSVTSSGSLTLGGTLSLTSGQVTSALGYTPPQPNGTGASGTWGISITGNAATVTNGLYKTGVNAVPAAIQLNTTADNWMWLLQAGGGNDWYFGPSTANFGIGANRLAISSSGGSANSELVIERGTTRLLEVLQANLQYKGNVVLHAGNYNDYAPSKTGTGASGTWSINVTGNAATTSQRNFTGDIASTGQGRFTGWYDGASGNNSLAAEIGVSGGAAYILSYNRGTSSYATLQLAATNIQLVPQGGALTGPGGNVILHAGNYGSGYFKTINGSSIIGTGDLTVSGTDSTKLPLAGGTLTGELYLPNLTVGGQGRSSLNAIGGNLGATAGSWNNSQLELKCTDAGTVALSFHRAGYTANTIEVRDGNGLRIDGNFVLHAGNYGSYALPLSGGTISGAIRASQITAGGSTNTDANLGVQGSAHITGTIYYGGTVGNINSWSSISTSSSGTHTFSGSRFIFDRYGYGSQPLIDMQSGSITLSQPTYATNGITVNDAAANGRGINLYSGSPTSPTYGLFFAQTGNFGTYGAVSADWATYFTMNSTAHRGWIFREHDSLGNVAAISNQGNMTIRSHFEQGNNIARPNVSWSASSTSTGMVIFYLPGTTGNYGMVHMVFDIYEYNSNAVSTVIVGGHNWSTSWYNVGANVIGQCGKEVRLGVKNGRFCVVFGTAGSSWEYGTIVLRKIHNGSFYDNIMNMVGDWESTQTTTESFTSITGDLRALRTPASFNAGGAITQAGNQVLHAGNYTNYFTYNTWDEWLRENGDNGQFKIYGNSRTLIFRTDGSDNPHGGGGYSSIWYHGGSADGNRRMILDTSGGLWTNSYGWLHDYFLAKSGGTMTGAISTPAGTSIYLGSQNVSTSSRLIINWHTDTDYNYLIGKRAGAWTQPLDVSFYTGIRYHANNAYGGHKFYAGGYDTNYVFSVGDGDSHVRVYNNLYVSGDSRGYEVYTTGGWFRNHTNNNGIYWSTTGWHLYPADTGNFYVRSGTSAGSLLFLNSGGSGLGYVHAAADAAMGFLNTSGNWRLRVDNSGNTTCYNNLYLDQNYGHGHVGLYNSYRYQGVFFMGDAYKMSADGTSLANMYGIGWSHPNAGGAAGNLTDHGMLIINNGFFRCAISNSIVASGNITAYSDERLKKNWRDMPENFVERLSQVRVGCYERIDDGVQQVGVSAQSLQPLLPEAIQVSNDEMKTLSVSYGNAALASAVELAKELVMLKKELAEIKSRLH